MKRKLKSLCLLLMTSVLLFSCDNTDDILVRKGGQWNITSLNERTFRDGELLTDTDSTTNLGSVLFQEDGSGNYLDANGNPLGSSFTWTYEDFALTITQDGESLVTTVLESSRKDQRWVTIVEEDLLGFIYRTETTTVLELFD